MQVSQNVAPAPRAALLTIAGTGAHVGFSRATVTRWTYWPETRPEGWPEAVRVGSKAIRYRLIDLDRWLAGLPLASSQPRILAPNVRAGRGRAAHPAPPLGSDVAPAAQARPKRGRPRKEDAGDMAGGGRHADAR